MTRTLAVRTDSAGDVLLAGPAIRALAGLGPVDLVVSPAGLAAGRLLPAVAELLVFDPPWSGYRPPAVDAAAVAGFVQRVAAGGYDRAVVLTSFHQSPLPMALLLQLAGIAFVAADSEDYPGSLLQLRHRRGDGHEVAAALALAAATGAPLPAGDDGRLALRADLPGHGLQLPRPFVVVHPGASVPSRAPTPGHARRIVAALLAAGHTVVVTGGEAERDLAREVAAPGAVDASGRLGLGQLATLLAEAACVVVGNTGPAHLAAAVGTPVVSLFSPVVPAARWAPYGVPVELLGDQRADCRDSRARECPLAGHPCLSRVDPQDVVSAVARLTAAPAATSPLGVPEGVPG
jgi:ADP-heptose:LPS heptosyltransferase